MRVSTLLWRCALVLSLGALALIFLHPSVRAHRERLRDRCVVCRRRQRWQLGCVVVVAMLVVVGSVMRIQQVTSATPPPCDAYWFASGQRLPSTPEQRPSPAWRWTRNVVTTPITGLAYAYARARGMDVCAVGPITVAFLPRAATTSGATVGDVFLTKVQPKLTEERAEALARHESRHVTQWTVLTLAGGPLALPVLYTVDEVFFPGSRNHFERHAGLSSGGYDRPAGFGPKPLWPGVALVALALLLLAWPRIRWLSRGLARGRAGTSHTRPGRCPRHTPGWFHSP